MEDEALRQLIRQVMAESPNIVSNVQRGKAGGQGFLLGRVLMQMPTEEPKEPSHVFTLLQEELGRG